MWLCARAVAVCILGLSLSQCAGPVRATPADADEAESLCGPRCLLHVCQALGVNTSIKEITSASRYDERAGTSLLGLTEVRPAQRCGTGAEGPDVEPDRAYVRRHEEVS